MIDKTLEPISGIIPIYFKVLIIGWRVTYIQSTATLIIFHQQLAKNGNTV